VQEITAANKASAAAQLEFSNVKEQRAKCFNETFEYVAGQIGHVYSDLTRSASKPGSEGANLYRMNPEEPYADGIRFSAIPPGKRFMSMKDLSGGEKTIAALALLLAIHSYKPSPFFVFDEVLCQWSLDHCRGWKGCHVLAGAAVAAAGCACSWMILHDTLWPAVSCFCFCVACCGTCMDCVRRPGQLQVSVAVLIFKHWSMMT
jgi:hypothetical protein